jgi:hypothetical protein
MPWSLIFRRFNKDACFGSRSTISTFLMLLHNNGIILMVLWVEGAFIVPPCPIFIIYYAKGKYIYSFSTACDLCELLFSTNQKGTKQESANTFFFSFSFLQSKQSA